MTPSVRSGGLPVDPDVEEPAPAEPFARRRPAGPRLRPGVLVAVFVGGAAGGAARYAATSIPHSPSGGFPWATFAVNVAGAFILALVVVAAAELVQTRYLRPLLGTGFCGGLTTFSSVVVAADRMIGRGQVGLAVGYLGATVGAALAAVWAGLLLARTFVAVRRRGTERSGS